MRPSGEMQPPPQRMWLHRWDNGAAPFPYFLSGIISSTIQVPLCSRNILRQILPYWDAKRMEKFQSALAGRAEPASRMSEPSPELFMPASNDNFYNSRRNSGCCANSALAVTLRQAVPRSYVQPREFLAAVHGHMANK